MDAAQNHDVLVLGLGNTLLTDDGVGVHVVRRLSEDATTPLWVRAVDGGTMGFRLTSVLNTGGDVLIVDAADFDAPPGTIRLLDAEALAIHVVRSKRTSAHEAGLADLLGLMRMENIVPRRLSVLTIQPLSIAWGETLTEPVANAVGPACELIKSIAMDWHGGQ